MGKTDRTIYIAKNEVSMSSLSRVIELKQDRQTRPNALSAAFADINPFNASCSKLLLFEGFSSILV